MKLEIVMKVEYRGTMVKIPSAPMNNRLCHSLDMGTNQQLILKSQFHTEA